MWQGLTATEEGGVVLLKLLESWQTRGVLPSELASLPEALTRLYQHGDTHALRQKAACFMTCTLGLLPLLFPLLLLQGRRRRKAMARPS